MLGHVQVMAPVHGTLSLQKPTLQVVQCGQFHLGFSSRYLRAQQIPGASVPEDVGEVTRLVHGGRLRLSVSMRSAPGISLAGVRVGVRLCTWRTWPGDFGAQGTSGPSTLLQRWGPELTQRLDATGSCQVDLTEWAGGSRFLAVELLSWSLDGLPVRAELDWQLFEDRQAQAARKARWPLSMRVSDLKSEPLTPDGIPLVVNRVGGLGPVHGRSPRLAVVTNSGATLVNVVGVARYGAARERLADAVLLQGESAIVAKLSADEPATGLDVYASSADPNTPLTLDFA